MTIVNVLELVMEYIADIENKWIRRTLFIVAAPLFIVAAWILISILVPFAYVSEALEKW